mmetsp:Transcript_19017/g.53651  ORF Transcript_19017/g.53651 Transcript_19017/m.53651 type:complete len:379 (-) Transcript_19017:84-1220(-)
MPTESAHCLARTAPRSLHEEWVERGSVHPGNGACSCSGSTSLGRPSTRFQPVLDKENQAKDQVQGHEEKDDAVRAAALRGLGCHCPLQLLLPRRGFVEHVLAVVVNAVEDGPLVNYHDRQLLVDRVQVGDGRRDIADLPAPLGGLGLHGLELQVGARLADLHVRLLRGAAAAGGRGAPVRVAQALPPLEAAQVLLLLLAELLRELLQLHGQAALRVLPRRALLLPRAAPVRTGRTTAGPDPHLPHLVLAAAHQRRDVLGHCLDGVLRQRAVVEDPEAALLLHPGQLRELRADLPEPLAGPLGEVAPLGRQGRGDDDLGQSIGLITELVTGQQQRLLVRRVLRAPQGPSEPGAPLVQVLVPLLMKGRRKVPRDGRRLAH